MSYAFGGHAPCDLARGMGHTITRTGAHALRPLIISSLLAVFATTSADAGQGPGYIVESESTTGLQNICVYHGPAGPAVSGRQLCPDAMAMATPTVSPTVVPVVDPSEQLAQIRAQYEMAHVRQQIAITAATINARANDADELVALLKLWGQDQARLTDVLALAQQQGVLLDAQADELLELQRQLADARFVTP
jgi:PII-like signaling protein